MTHTPKAEQANLPLIGTSLSTDLYLKYICTGLFIATQKMNTLFKEVWNMKFEISRYVGFGV